MHWRSKEIPQKSSFIACTARSSVCLVTQRLPRAPLCPSGLIQLAFICKPQRWQCDQACNLQFQAATPQGMQREMAGSKIKFNLNASSALNVTRGTHTHTHTQRDMCACVCSLLAALLGPNRKLLGKSKLFVFICKIVQRVQQQQQQCQPACLSSITLPSPCQPDMM